MINIRLEPEASSPHIHTAFSGITHPATGPSGPLLDDQISYNKLLQEGLSSRREVLLTKVVDQKVVTTKILSKESTPQVTE